MFHADGGTVEATLDTGRVGALQRPCAPHSPGSHAVLVAHGVENGSHSGAMGVILRCSHLAVGC